MTTTTTMVTTASTAGTLEESHTQIMFTDDEPLDCDNAAKCLRQEEVVKDLLAKHHGSTKNPQVLAAINDLAALWKPQHESIGRSSLLEGEFLCHTLPEFPGRIKNSPPGVVQYTLGRLSFGIFQPRNLVCTVRSVRQSIQSRSGVKDSITGKNNRSKFQTFDYPICLDLTIHTANGVDLPAVMMHSGVCYESPAQRSKFPHRLNVTFKGSTLVPAKAVRQDPALLAVWTETFANAYSKAEAERGFLSKTMQSLLAWWFQMVLPNDEQAAGSADHSVGFEMKRSPRGHLDFLYLSDTLRITKGNRGTLVVVERMDSPTSQTTTM
ncbi:PAP_fibrillin [Seminavis robusta]|uniref:PAP_fibrillin n=1 Tax=Seminavis robusta TaxID=568900 RepID=A0A9N8EII3_9STRA|nr:PAP_fibrillin [Seminavis robusta]|eukprot:Sro1284_g259250.1 PAP_fibrillin (324) ;mRNA; r:24993-25964